MRKNSRSNFIRVFLVMLAAVVACSSFTVGSYAASVKTPAKAKAVTLESSTSSRISIKWAKVTNASKYQIAYKKSGAKSFKYITTAEGLRFYTIKNLKKSTYYYVKIRGVNGTKKGKWSASKKIKTKASANPDKDSTTGVNYKKAVNEGKIKVSVTNSHIKIAVSSLGKKGTGTLYSVPANKYISGDKLKGITSGNNKGTKIGTLTLNKSKTFTISRYSSNGYDRLYDKYYIVKRGKIVRGPVYATDIASFSNEKVEKDVPSKKGLVDEVNDDAFAVSEDIGSNWTALNIDFTQLILANETTSGRAIDNSGAYADTIVVNGKTYYINKTYVDELDSKLRRYEQLGINVVGICISFVSSEAENSYPRALKYIGDARWTNGFNTSGDLGRDYFIAGMEYLAGRYSQQGNGLICDYVIGNEIDMAYDWYEVKPNFSTTGDALPDRAGNREFRPNEVEARVPFDTFMEEYSRTLRLANLAVKKYSSDIRVGVSLSKEWNISRSKRDSSDRMSSKRWDSYSPREILDWLNYYSKKSGDFNWTITPHNYPVASGDAAAFETGLSEDSKGNVLITGDPDTTPVITLNNLEVLQLYLDRSYNKFNGKVREVFFTENGSSSGTEPGTPDPKMAEEQAAEVAQYYYRAACLPSVKALIYYKINDRESEGATNFKLGLKDTNGEMKPSYEVWKYIDTDRSFEVSQQYLKSLSFKKNGKVYSVSKGNIASYRDLMEIVSSSFNWDKYWLFDSLERSAPMAAPVAAEPEEEEGTEDAAEPDAAEEAEADEEAAAVAEAAENEE